MSSPTQEDTQAMPKNFVEFLLSGPTLDNDVIDEMFRRPPEWYQWREIDLDGICDEEA